MEAPPPRAGRARGVRKGRASVPEAVGASLEEGLARDQLLRDDAGASEHGEAAW